MKRLLSVLSCVLFGFSVCTGCVNRSVNSQAKDSSAPEEQWQASNPDWPDGTTEDLNQYDLAQYDQDNYLTPVWDDEGIARCETVFVMQEQDGSIAPISLLYPAKQIISVRNYGLDDKYEEGKDYTLTSDGKLQILNDGAIKSMPYEQYYLDVYDPGSSANMKEVYGNGAQIYTESIKDGEKSNLGMTEWQITVTYSHSALWSGSVPQDQSGRLQKTNAVLSGGGTLKIACLGDSISQGWSSSGYENVDIAPHMPSYIQLFKEGLQSKFKKSAVDLKNFSVAGKTSRWPLYEADGIANFNELLNYKADLVVLAFGMNDGGSIQPADYSANMESIIDKILKNKADTEIVLISSMLPNQEIRANWGSNGPLCNYQPTYKAVLQRISLDCLREGKSVVFADVLSVNQHILKYKRFRDITSNNVNHPNDYMHRVYAQVLLRTVSG